MARRMVLIEEALEEERLERRRNRRRLRDSFNINTVPDLEFISNYRLTRALFEELCQDIVPLLPRKRNRRAVEPTTKILVALNFYARGSYQGSVGQNDDAPMAQQTVSRCIREVSLAINTPTILRKYIKFPQNTTDRNITKRKFYEKYNLPGVIGCIDCTHIAIVRPSEHEERFFNRKHFHSINTQVICDSDCVILDVNATYGGATHDAYIWSQCDVKSHLESLNETAYLLGDSGYPLRKYLITPVSNAVEDSPEGRFNALQETCPLHHRAHIWDPQRSLEVSIGSKELHYDPERAGKIILACCVLHNMCIKAGVSAPELSQDDFESENSRQVISQASTSATDALRSGQRERERLIALLENSN